MDRLISYCGLVCRTCPIYLATREENTDEKTRMRAYIARVCRERYGMTSELEDITDCDGCRTEGGRLFTGSRSCAIRKCAREKGLENCAHCPEYICGKLEAFFVKDPQAKIRLDEARSSIL